MKKAQSLIAAAAWVQDLMDLLDRRRPLQQEDEGRGHQAAAGRLRDHRQRRKQALGRERQLLPRP